MRLTPDKKLHSREHLLADDLSRMLGEERRFAAYLGIAKRYYESDLRGLVRRVLEKQDLPQEARGKYFFAALRDKPQRPESRRHTPKPKKKKRKKRRVRMQKNHKTLPIIKVPQKVLRSVATDVPVTHIREPDIQDLIAAMKITLANTPDGVGLAAPQVGQSLRLFIVSEEAEEIDRSTADIERRFRRRALAGQVPESGMPPNKSNIGSGTRPWKYYVFINPVVKNKARGKALDAEGCLSVPGKFGHVKRCEKITVESLDEHGKKFLRGSANFFARVVQHELDHLDGTLFIDKAEEIIEVSPEEPRK